ncbi:MAG: peptidylprolyl isomerase [Alphaproteobacteria bacterium]|nr:peptidylprolyl isomerase [Alphaproteobacteria bacterium]
MKSNRLALVALLVLMAGAAKAADTAARPENWRPVDPQNLVLMDVKYGRIALELAPEFAPLAVARFKALIRAHFYDGKSFYRVIDGFVAQGGIGEGTAATGSYSPEVEKHWPPLPAEFDAPYAKGLGFTPLGNKDLYAPEVGHVNGFPVGRDPKAGRMWIIHCPGTLAFARDNGADTATTEFYVVIGEAPRRLDRNLTAFGRVIDGLQYLQKLTRGDPDIANGVIQDKAKADKILKVAIAADLPEKERPRYAVMRTDGPAFAAWKQKRKNPAPGFYVRTPPPILDICLALPPVRRMN